MYKRCWLEEPIKVRRWPKGQRGQDQVLLLSAENSGWLTRTAHIEQASHKIGLNYILTLILVTIIYLFTEDCRLSMTDTIINCNILFSNKFTYIQFYFV